MAIVWLNDTICTNWPFTKLVVTFKLFLCVGRTDYPTYPRSLKSVTLFHDFRFCAPGCMSHKNEQNMSYSEILLRLIYNFCNLYWADQVKVLLPCFVSIFMKIYQQKIFTQCASENNQNIFFKITSRLIVLVQLEVFLSHYFLWLTNLCFNSIYKIFSLLLDLKVSNNYVYTFLVWPWPLCHFDRPR